MNGYKKIKIDIIAPPFSGHLYPLLEMIKSFADDERFDICIYTGFNKKSIVEKLGFKCRVLFENKKDIFEKIANTPGKISILGMYKQFRENLALIPEIVSELEKEFIKRDTDIIIADFVAVPAGIACNRLSIPWITTIPTPFAIESKNTTPSYLGGLYPHSNMIFKIRDILGRFIIRNVKRFFCLLAGKELKKLKFHLYNEKENENIYSPYSILGIGMSEIEFRNDFPEQFIWAGPCSPVFNKEKEISIDIPDKFQKSILVSNGTHLLWSKKDLIEIVKKLASIYSDIYFIVSLGDEGGKNYPAEKAAENIIVHRYIPYESIFSAVDYVIHHGGAGILYNCIKFNKPSLIIPHDYDQFDYAVRAELSGIAVIAKRKSEKSIIGGMKKLIEKKKWEDLNKLSADYKNYNPNKVLENEIYRLLTLKKQRGI